MQFNQYVMATKKLVLTSYNQMVSPFWFQHILVVQVQTIAKALLLMVKDMLLLPDVQAPKTWMLQVELIRVQSLEVMMLLFVILH